MLKELLKNGWYRNADEGGGSATLTPEEEAAAADAAKIEEDAKAEADAKAAEEAKAEEDRIAAEKAEAEANDPEVLRAKLETLQKEIDERKQADDAKAEADLKAADAARAATKPSQGPAEIPDFRTQAYDEAEAYGAEHGFLDAEGQWTDKGIAWAENRASSLAAEHVADQRRMESDLREIQAQKPAMVASYAKDVAEQFKLEPAVAEQIGKDYAEIVVGYGLAAFPRLESIADPAKRETVRAYAEKLQTTAEYVALGMQKRREIEAAKEGGAEGDGEKHKEGPGTPPPNAKGLSKDAVEFEKKFIAKHEGTMCAGETLGKSLTAKQREFLKSEYPACYE